MSENKVLSDQISEMILQEGKMFEKEYEFEQLVKKVLDSLTKGDSVNLYLKNGDFVQGKVLSVSKKFITIVQENDEVKTVFLNDVVFVMKEANENE